MENNKNEKSLKPSAINQKIKIRKSEIRNREKNEYPNNQQSRNHKSICSKKQKNKKTINTQQHKLNKHTTPHAIQIHTQDCQAKQTFERTRLALCRTPMALWLGRASMMMTRQTAI